MAHIAVNFQDKDGDPIQYTYGDSYEQSAISVLLPGDEQLAAMEAAGYGGSVNYYSNPSTLSAWGNGMFLMTGTEAAAMWTALVAPEWGFRLKFEDQKLPASQAALVGEFEIPAFVSEMRVILGFRPDESIQDDVVSVSVVDERYRLRNKPAVGNFNIRGQGDDWYTQTTNGGTPWTWLEVFQNLFDQLKQDTEFSYISLTELPDEPPGVPENVQAENRSIVNILDDLAEFNGWHWIWVPYDGTGDDYGPRLVKVSAEDSTVWDVQEGLSRSTAFAGDLGEYLPSATSIPGSIKIAFPNRFDGGETQWALNSAVAVPVYPHTVLEASTGPPGSSDVDDRQILVVFDPVMAILPSPLSTPVDPAEPLNLTDLQARADYIADRIWDFKVISRPGRRTDTGFLKYDITSIVQTISWQITQDGAITVTEADDGLVPKWLRTPDTQIASVDGIVASPVSSGRILLTAAIPRLIYVAEPTTDLCAPC